MRRVEYQKQVTDLGLRIFPLVGKKPPQGYPWKERAGSAMVPGESYGIICDKVAVIDADTREKAIEMFHTKPRTPWMVRTPRGGVHFFYRGSPDLPCGQYEDWDLRAGGKGYVVGVGSVVRGRVYELVGEITLDLPAFDPAWIPQRGITASNGRAPREVRNVAKYVMQIESVQGEGGSRGLVRAAAVCRDAGMSEAEAVVLLLHWNRTDKVRPPWSDDEIARAVTRTYARTNERTVRND